MRREHFPDFMFLLETKNSSTHVVNIQRSLGYDRIHVVDPDGLSGGLALLWKSSYEVEVLQADKRIIDVKVKLGSLWFYISFVYGEPVSHLRQEVWDRLTEIGSTRDEAWLVIGDLNAIFDNSEKLGGPMREEASFLPFRSMIHDCGLREVPSSGNKFSWAGTRENVYTQCCLDRALGNSDWFNVFPRVHTEYLERIGSDHRPILTRFTNENISRQGRFMFDKRWISRPEVEALIKESWNIGEDNEAYPLFERIADCRRALSKWKRTSNTNSNTCIKNLRDSVEAEGNKLRPDLRLLKKLKYDLADAYRKEEGYWRQKSKDNWLKEGDQNTAFFHGSVKRRRAQNSIPILINEEGVEQVTEGSKGEVAVEYFRKLFTSTRPESAWELLDGMQPRVTPAMNRDLTRQITDGEIRQAAFGIKSNKTPGADGMTGQFFQSYWHIVGASVIKEVKRFFVSGELPQEWNFTQLCLLPKKPNPKLMSDLRPISLCSVMYKIVSRVLCARLKSILPEIVSETQGAFVAGRLISDNILLAHEMVHALKTNPRCSEDFMALKTDMSKAYDRVEWGFLMELFSRMGFDKKWIDWIMVCVSSVSYSVLLNGRSHGFITPSRGLRQGDPLSPFLFILCAEALVHTMNKSEIEGRISGIKLTSESPSIQQLLFADDSLFMCRASFKEGSEILRCLKLYGEASGQEINFQKSSITFGKKIDSIMKRVLGLYMGIEQEGGTGKYLGLPECFNGSKIKLLAFITENLKDRLSGWYANTLSFGGKETLLKSVAMALPVYAMSCFKLTKHQCQKITSAMSRFWWNTVENKRKIHWVAWDKMCQSKKEGGLGFRDIESFNQALLAKQAWRLIDRPNSLITNVYKSRYFPEDVFMEAEVGVSPSYAWRSIIHGRELLEKGLLKSIGNGKDTLVWLDKWILDGTPRRPCNKQRSLDVNLRVDALITDRGAWKIDALKELFLQEDIDRILSFPPNRAAKDRLIWAHNKGGCYTVKSGNWLISKLGTISNPANGSQQTVNDLKTKSWQIETEPKIRLFLWRILSGALAVAERISTRGIQLNVICNLCHGDVESIKHVLFQCVAARQVWRNTCIPLLQRTYGSVEEYTGKLYELMNSGSVPENHRRAIPWLLWEIWKTRNSRVMAGNQGDAHITVATAIENADIWFQMKENGVTETSQHRATHHIIKSWTKPEQGCSKCNIFSSWVNPQSLCGGAWIVRDHNGEAKYHAREVFLAASNRIAAEFRCTIWALQSLHDIHEENVEIWSDCVSMIEAIKNPRNWPRYRSYIDRLWWLTRGFRSCTFTLSTSAANKVARKIATSVTSEGRHQSYLAVGGPRWLSGLIESEKRY